MLNLPQVLRIGAFDFRVESWEHMAAAAAGKFGEFSAIEMVIRVDQTVNHYKVIDTLLHEVHHAIWWAYGIQDSDAEERIVNILSSALLQVFRDNPELVVWIRAMLQKAGLR
jgi:hypothetical protein